MIAWRHAATEEPHEAQPDPSLVEEIDGQAVTECLVCRQMLMLTDG